MRLIVQQRDRWGMTFTSPMAFALSPNELMNLPGGQISIGGDARGSEAQKGDVVAAIDHDAGTWHGEHMNVLAGPLWRVCGMEETDEMTAEDFIIFFKELVALAALAGHPSPGRAPWGRAPGWVPGAHQSRPEAQGRREKEWAKGRLQGGTTDKGVHSNERDCITVQKAGYCGAQEVGINAGQTGWTTKFFFGEERARRPLNPIPKRTNGPTNHCALLVRRAFENPGKIFDGLKYGRGLVEPAPYCQS